MSLSRISKLKFLTLALMLVVSAAAPMMLGHASAAVTNTLVRFDRMKTSQATTGTVCFKPATAGTEATVDVTFPAGYTLGAFTTFTVTTTNLAWPTGANAWLGINTATAKSSQTVTFPSGDLVVGTLYCFNWDNSAAVQVTGSAGPNLSGTVVTRTSVPAVVDSSSYSTASVSSPDDQITVTATISQTFSMALSANTDTLGALSAGSIVSSPTPTTATINTNAANGWYVWAKDSSTGLASVAASHTIPSRTPGTVSTLAAGAEGYNTGVTTTSGTVDPAFDSGVVAGKGGGLDTSLRTLVSSSGVASNAVVTLKNNVTIAGGTQPASDYTDVITVVGAGLF